jgi:hypothetical protein
VAIPFFVFLLSSYVPAQVIIKEKVEINPQSVIIPDAPLSNHILRVDIQWSPASLPGWIMYYDLNCDQNNYSSASSTTGSNTFSHSSLGYENYQIQFRFGSLDPNQPTITGTYQLYYDEQLIRSESFQAQKATYSSYAYFNTHYQSPVLTDYNFSIFASEICPGSYEDIYITTSRNCNATAEINTELDSITLTIETGREFVSFYKNSQKKDTITFMYHELGSVYLRQDSTYTGTAPINVNIKSDWTGLIKYQQLVINPQEQFQIRVPDQPIIVFSGGVRGFKIETYSSDNCPPFISENLRYTALIKKGINRGLLYDYDTGQSGDTLINLTPQEDGEKYLDFITEGEILSQTDTVIVKVFTNDENIDTTETVIFIYPNDIDVQIIPSVISQGDTARVVIKKRGVNGLEDFAADKVFNVEIVQGLDYGLILDSLSNDTLTIFSNIPQGFKIIAKDSTETDSTKIRIKVTTEESGFPVARMIRNNTKTNKNEVVDDNENKKNDDEIITPDWIIPGPILLEGFGDVIVKEDVCNEEIVYAITNEQQKTSSDSSEIKLLRANSWWNWTDLSNIPHFEQIGDPVWYGSTGAGATLFLQTISANSSVKWNFGEDLQYEILLDTINLIAENFRWIFNVSNLRVPILSDISLWNLGRTINLGDATDTTLLANYIKNDSIYTKTLNELDIQIEGVYSNQFEYIEFEYFPGMLKHEEHHFLMKKHFIIKRLNEYAFRIIRKLNFKYSEYPCPTITEIMKTLIIGKLKLGVLWGGDLSYARDGAIDLTGFTMVKMKKDNTYIDVKVKNHELAADEYASEFYRDVKQRIINWWEER